MECITFHLLTIFHYDVAETQRYYISNGVKKPNRVPIRQFRQCIQQLNGQLSLLPCFFISPHTTKLTKKAGHFDDSDLMFHILCMCPGTARAQYELIQDRVPQSIWKCLNALKRSYQLIMSMTPTNERSCHSMTPSPRRVAKMPSIISCVRDMGACTPLKTCLTVISIRRTVLA